MTQIPRPGQANDVTARAYVDDDDFRRIRRLLIETCPTTELHFNWDVRRWDGWRFYAADPNHHRDPPPTVRMWETADGRLVGAVHSEGPGDAHLQIHPDFRQLIEEEMVTWAERNLARPAPDGRRSRLRIFVFEYDTTRQRLLEQRGYAKRKSGGVARLLRFGDERHAPPEMPPGYKLRTTRPGDADDFQRIADLLNVAFNRDFHCADEFRMFTMHAPSFRHDLDLVAEAPDGSFACYVGVPYDDDNRRGIFEPVCTHPDHTRRGLAKTLMLEALHRLKALGARDVTVGTGDQAAANRLYDSIGFTDVRGGHEWTSLDSSETPGENR